MKTPAFEIIEVLKPGTKTPYHYDLYVDGNFAYGRKSVREYNWGAVERETIRGPGTLVDYKHRIVAMRKIPKFDFWIHNTTGISIMPVKKARS